MHVVGGSKGAGQRALNERDWEMFLESTVPRSKDDPVEDRLGVRRI